MRKSFINVCKQSNLIKAITNKVKAQKIQMMNIDKLTFDQPIATEKGLTFTVAKKEKKGAPWVDLKENIENLLEAFQFSISVESFEVAIFVVYKFGGIHYWSSRHPEIFNSGALTHQNN